MSKISRRLNLNVWYSEFRDDNLSVELEAEIENFESVLLLVRWLTLNLLSFSSAKNTSSGFVQFSGNNTFPVWFPFKFAFS